MLKRRIIPVQLLLGNRLVKTVQFDQHRDVGHPVSSSKVYNSQEADELIFLNIDRAPNGIDALTRLIDQVSEVCFMPLTVGGGIRTAEEAATLIRHGADKVALNTAAYIPDIISEIAGRFGRQAVIAALDVRRVNNDFKLYTDCGTTQMDIPLDEHIANVVRAGAGEILVQSIDRDGGMAGYDIDMVSYVRERSEVPVIALGGAGNYEHLRDVFLKADVNAAACGSLFNFTDSNPMRAKAFLSNYGLRFKIV